MIYKKSQAGFIMLVFLVVIIGAAGYYYYFLNNGNNPFGSQNNGRVVFAITDAATNMQSVSQVLVTVESIQTHSTIDGWVNVSSSAKTFDLLVLKSQNKLELIADSNVKPGNYDQVRMQISKVIVVDSSGEHEAKLPSNRLKINTELEIKEDATATAVFDFIADESLHVTGNGKYILAPVIQVETRSDADVNLENNNAVVIKGGNVKSNKKVGMDASGNVDVNLNIPADADIDIDTEGKIKVKSTTNRREEKCGNNICEKGEADVSGRCG
ncbi:MAG: DUF4382 domain-containing protein, partial [Nanoarchaeota archaeon]